MTAESTQHFILFTVAGTTYAAPTALVRHIEMIEEITAVPNAPPAVDGVVFSRGDVVPVVNLRARFGFERAAPDLRTRLIVVDAGGRLVGLLADSAREFAAIPADAVRPPNPAISGISGNYIQGIATLGERLVFVLDVHDVIRVAPAAA